MSSGSAPPKGGHRGVIERVKVEGKVVHEREERRQIDPATVLPRHPARVGISLSAGMKTEFARESIDIVAWQELPCGLTHDERQQAFDACAEECTQQIEQRLDPLVRRFFPHMNAAAGDDS